MTRLRYVVVESDEPDENAVAATVLDLLTARPAVVHSPTPLTCSEQAGSHLWEHSMLRTMFKSKI